MADNAFEMIMSLVDEVTPGLEKIRDQLKQTQSSATNAGNALNNVGGGSGAGGGAGGGGGGGGRLATTMRGLAGAVGVATVALGALAIAAGAAYAALSYLNDAGRAGIDFGDELSDIAGKAGITAEELQKLRIVAETNGGSFEAVDKSLLKFNQTLGLAQQGSGSLLGVLQKLNISLYDQNGALKDTPTMYREVSQAIGAIENPAQQSALAIQAFGKSGAELVESMSMSKEETDAAREAAVKYGAVMSNEMTNAAAAAKDEITLLDKGTETLNARLNLMIGLPVAKWWSGVANWISQALVSLAEFSGLNDKFDASKVSEELAKTERNVQGYTDSLEQAKKRLADREFSGGRVHARLKQDVEWWQSRLDELKTKRDELAKQLDILQPKAEPQVTTTVVQEDTEKGLKALDAYRMKVEADRAANLQDAKEKAQALYDVEVQRLQQEYAAIAANSELSRKSKEEAWDLYNEHIKNASTKLVNELKDIDDKAAKEKAASDKKLSDARLKSDKEALDLAIKREEQEIKNRQSIDSIVEKYVQQTAQQQAVVSGTEKQLELRNAINEAEETAIKNGEELSVIDRERVENAVLNKQQSDEQLKQFNDQKDKAKATADEIKDIYKNAAQSIQSSFSDFFFDIMQGNMDNLVVSFKRTIDRMVADLLAAKLLSTVGGASGLSGMLGGLFSGFGGARAAGGPVTGGTPYLVGEQGPEIVVPGASGTVIPADISQAIVSGGGSSDGGSYQVSIHALDARSFMDLMETNDRGLIDVIQTATQKYRL